jgi:hypothetical protein
VLSTPYNQMSCFISTKRKSTRLCRKQNDFKNRSKILKKISRRRERITNLIISESFSLRK